MAGRTLVVPLAIALLTGAFAGCLSETVTPDPDYALNRQVRFHVDDANMRDLGEGEVYDFVDSAFVVHVRKVETAPSALVVDYRDRTGKDVSRPLSDFTTKPLLVPGDAVRIEDADLASNAVLRKDGAVVASRVLADPSWWNVGGMPTGFALDPGALLSYEVSGGFDETATVSDVRLKEPAVAIDSLTAAVHVTQETTGRLDFTGAEEVVTATTTHKARPLAWSFDGKVSTPMTLEVVGTDVGSGEAIQAGVEVLPVSGVTFEANGNLWVAGDGRAVLAEVLGGRFKTDADAVAWVVGVDDAAEFSCNGKTRADACRPTEWDLASMRMEQEIPPGKEELDHRTDDVPPALLENVTRFLAEDLQPGDELVFEVHLTDASEGVPDGAVLDWSAQIKAVDVERVTVKAGTFDALKVIEEIRIDSRVPALGETPVEIDQTVLQATFWFEPRTFVPVRLEYVVPFNVGQVADALLAAAGEDFWAEAPVERFDAGALNVVTETRFALELAEKKGEARFSPWMTILGAQYAGGAPGLALAGGAYVWAAGFGTSGAIKMFPQVTMKAAEAPATAVLEHRGGEPIGWESYEVRAYQGWEPVDATWARTPACADATTAPGGSFSVGDRLYVCGVEGESGELKIQIVDVDQNAIVYENTIWYGGYEGHDDESSGEWTSPPGADFYLVRFVVDSTMARVGEPVEISFEVQNEGDARSEATVSLLVDGETRATQEVAADPGETVAGGFDWEPDAPGRYTVAVSVGYSYLEDTVVVEA